MTEKNPLKTMYEGATRRQKASILDDLEAQGIGYQRFAYWLKAEPEKLEDIPLVLHRIIIKNIPAAEQLFAATAH